MIPIMMERGDFDRAISKLQELLNKGVNRPFCHAQLAIVHARQGELEKAAEDVRKALAGGSVNQSFLVLLQQSSSVAVLWETLRSC